MISAHSTLKVQKNDDYGCWRGNGNPSLNDFKKECKPAQRHEEESKIFCLKVNF